MLEEVAIVEVVTKEYIELSTRIQTTCGSCEQQSHCGTGIISRYLAPKPENLKIAGQFDVLQGQKVVIGIAEQAMLKLGFFIYLMPILWLAIVASSLSLAYPNMGEPSLVLISLATTGVYFSFLKLVIQNLGWQRLEPKIIRFIPEPDAIPVQNLP